MEIEEQRHGAVTVLRPRGPLIQTDADQFRKRAADVMARSLGRFVVDASGIAYTDSRGLEVLAEVSEELAQGGQVLRLCGAGETLREVLELTELSALFEHYEDVPTAVRSFL
ncbi:MAG: STAS domain-containing protein [Phycisphaerales bacterium]|nr:STAS domain-containing protein [Phycisphaerales bacterium]